MCVSPSESRAPGRPCTRPGCPQKLRVSGLGFRVEGLGHLVALARALVAHEGFGRHVVEGADSVVAHDVGRVVALNLFRV